MTRRLTSTQRRFIQKYVVAGNGCWLWMAARGQNGYGHFFFNGFVRRAHRASWEMHNGKIPEGMQVLHKCDARSCVNPGHLFLGTNTENVLDKQAKGRDLNYNKTHCPQNHPYSLENTYRHPDGRRQCRQCLRDGAMRRYYYKKEHNEMVAQYGFGARL